MLQLIVPWVAVKVGPVALAVPICVMPIPPAAATIAAAHEPLGASHLFSSDSETGTAALQFRAAPWCDRMRMLAARGGGVKHLF